MGGHYYAYIKDIETQKWYNFNDSVVKEISIIDIVETFGPEPVTGPQNRLRAKRLANTRQSNAYMLMYRLYDPQEDKKSLTIHEDCIPDSIKYDVELMEQK